MPRALLPLLLTACAPTPTSPALVPPTVLLLTVDSLSPRVLLGEDPAWDTAPAIHAFFEEAAVFPEAVSTRGMTAVALTSLLTGAWPREHGIRHNQVDRRPWAPTLADLFQAAGYATLGFSANQCQLLEWGFDERTCTSVEDDPDLGSLRYRDEVLVDAAVARIGALGPEEQAFVWVHLNLPHLPHDPVEPWYAEFHPEPYEGDLDPGSEPQVYEITLGERAYDEADRLHYEAAYASRVRATDANVDRVWDALRDAGRWDEALVVFGADHGEELADHNLYFYHGCSPYQSVLRVVYAVKAPGVVPGERTGRISITDVAPTMMELAAEAAWPWAYGGRSLVPALAGGDLWEEPVFFERSEGTAGVVSGHHAYLLSAEEGYADCKPYHDAGLRYPGATEELYDLSADPAQEADLAGQDLPEQAALRGLLCAWIMARPWSHEAAGSPALAERCTARNP